MWWKIRSWISGGRVSRRRVSVGGGGIWDILMRLVVVEVVVLMDWDDVEGKCMLVLLRSSTVEKRVYGRAPFIGL